MSSVQSSEERVKVRASNIGGIDESTVRLGAGVNVLTGRNATNRTSFLQALMAGLGSDHASLKGDADEGFVELTLGDEEYTRRLKRIDGGITATGNPYLDDPELADLFAFLLESNEARRAVARGGDLRELIMRPVDTEAIQAEVEQLKGERRRIDEQLDDLDAVKERLPRLERERSDLEAELEEKRADLEEKRAELEASDDDVESRRDEKAELDEKLNQLNETRSSLEDVRFRIETAEKSLDSLREERDEIDEQLEGVPDAPAGELAEVDDRIERLRDEKRKLDSLVNKLQNLIRFNQDILEGDDDLLMVLDELHEEDSESVTNQLLAGDDVTCWTCGTEVQRDRIESTLDRLRDISRAKRSKRSQITDELDDLKSERGELERQRDRQTKLERDRSRIESQVDEREENIESLREERASLEARVEELEDDVDRLESEDYSAVLDKHKETNQLEFEVERLESDLGKVDDDIDDCEERIGEEAELEARREEIGDELEDLRTRIDRLEAEAVDAFNDHMDRVLDLLGYENLDRIWIERTEETVREGRRKVTQNRFELHVIRSNETGASYEDTIDHLSESEREVTGLVFALAGYLVHELHEIVPFMLLDSLEAIDSERIATLVDYFSEYADYLVVALLPEDAQALDDAYRRITEI